MNEFTTQPWTFEEDLERYAQLGVETLEMCEQKLDDQRFEEQMAKLADSGLVVSAVQPLVRTFGASQIQSEPVGVRSRVNRLRASIQRLAPYAPGSTFVVNTGAADQGNMDRAVQQTIQELTGLAGWAADHGVRIALEPLNATLMNTETAIWTVSQALDIIEAVDHEQVGICLDLWHVWQETHLEPQILRASDRIFLLHVSDWRTPGSPRDRLVPGDGIIPIGKLLHTVYEAGYDGSSTVEIFSQDVVNSLYQSDLSEVIQRSRAGLEHA
ncbi:sugar phosphate isomerase/epimerase family protein [Larkinella insperata]|uniref:sugar phosphate isomerase/epimerase family protein n=1 Tax=Larkinella insperata TaxID=332158 RepID=UPI0036D3D1D3